VEQVTALAGVVDHLYSSLYWFQVSQADLDQHPAKPQLVMISVASELGFWLKPGPSRLGAAQFIVAALQLKIKERKQSIYSVAKGFKF
jgi:hypothetical protein